MEMKLNINDAFDHLAGLGVALWADEYVRANPEETQPVLLHWKDNDTFVIECGEHDDAWFAEAVKAGIDKVQSAGWLLKAEDGYDSGKRSPLSPRRRFGEDGAQEDKEDRSRLIDAMGLAGAASQRLAVGLGQPGYWCLDGKAQARLDGGASLWEMADRRRGCEFVNCRMANLLSFVRKWDKDKIAEGIAGASCRDEMGGDKQDSMTPTGLRYRSRTDNARAWCAFWAIGLFDCRPVVRPRFAAHSNVTGALEGGREGASFYLPVLTARSTLDRYRSVLRSAALARCARAEGELAARERGDAEWLLSHSCGCYVVLNRRCEIVGNTADYWIDQGTVYPVPEP